MQAVQAALLSLTAALTLTSCAATGSAGNSSEGNADAGPPNIVFIMADDMGYGDLACFNSESKITTPRIDALAAAGMRFTDAHAPGSVCIPSRYGLLTGRYPCRQGSFRPNLEPVIPADQITIASFLGSQGYATGMVGKWHQGFEGGGLEPGPELQGGPLDRGFDDFFGIHASLDIPPYYYIRGRRPVAPPTGSIGDSNTEGWTDIQGVFWREGGLAPGFVHADVQPRFEAESINWLDERARKQDGPFFLYVALAAPHTPWLPTEEFAGKSAVDMYGDFVSQVDAGVGRILDALERNGQAQNTLVFFTSDNGPVWYPADVERLGHDSVGGLRGMKADAHEGGHRMPFIARWPGRVPAGSVCDQMLCFTDMLATFADVSGAPLPAGAGEDSYSLLPVLLDPTARTTRKSLVHKANASSIRVGKWKLITHLGSGGFSCPRKIKAEEGGPQGQLFDLEVDPGETNNLWSTHPEIVKELGSVLAPYLVKADK